MYFDPERPLPPLIEGRRAFGESFELGYITELMRRSDGKHARAAELAGVSRQLITRLVNKHGLGRD
jgi:hypothetical protein